MEHIPLPGSDPAFGPSPAVQESPRPAIHANPYRLKAARKVIKDSFVIPSRAFPMHSAVDDRITMPSLEEVCPEIIEKVAAIYLHIPSETPVHVDAHDVPSSHRKSLQHPMFAFLVQRWVFTHHKVWIPGGKLDEWYCRRYEAERRAIPALSPYLLDCQIHLSATRGNQIFKDLLYPFKRWSVNGICEVILDSEFHQIAELANGPPAAQHREHFLFDVWRVVYQSFHDNCSSTAFEESTCLPRYLFSLENTKIMLRGLTAMVKAPLSAYRMQSKLAAAHCAHLNTIYSASPFDLLGTCFFLTAKAALNSNLNGRVLSRKHQDHTSDLLEKIHADCLLFFNYRECRPPRIGALLDTVTYFTTSAPLLRVSASAPPVRRAAEPAARSRMQKSHITSSGILERSEISDVPHNVTFSNSLPTCLKDRAIVDNFRKIYNRYYDTAYEAADDDGDDEDNGEWPPGQELDHIATEPDITLPPKEEDDCLECYIRSEEEQKKYAAARAVLYPKEEMVQPSE